MAGCRMPAPAVGPRVYEWPAPPRGAEVSCAWFGDAHGEVLYFGVSAFWSAARAGQDPMSDLREPGPRWIGRFDLEHERFLPPLELRAGDAPTGVWDVLVHPNGRIYYTTWFDHAGSVDPVSGAVEEFSGAGLGLNELALGPDGRILVSRYGFAEDGEGSLVELSERGEILAEHVLRGPPGYRTTAKSLAFDPLRHETWVNTDLFPLASGGVLHDARVLDAAGVVQRVIADPELQFFVFDRDGRGLFAEAAGRQLRLRERSADGTARVIPLDDAFDPAHDFAQDVRVEPDGSVVVTRWGGRIHVVEGSRIRNLALPSTGTGELYYTGVRRGSRVCVTRCGRIEVVCTDLP